MSIIHQSHSRVIRLMMVSMMFLLVRCSSNDEKYPVIDADFCSQLHVDSLKGLSDQLASIYDSMSEKTGVYSLEEGDNAMIARVWLTQSAEKTIDIQYFIFSGDNVGLIAVDYLLRAADKGVKVRLLVDDIMVEADADELLALNTHPNLKIKIYNPTANIGKNLPQKLYKLTTDFIGVNQRMHNKTFIVDGSVVITGGRNIADEYFDYDHEYNFRDRDVLLVGSAVEQVVNSFNQFWDSPLSVPVDQLVSEDELKINAKVKFDYLHQYACDPGNFWPQVREKIRMVPEAFRAIKSSGDFVWADSVSFVSDIPGKNDGERGLSGGGVCTDTLISLIKHARKSILIQSPYLVTTKLSQQLFRDAIDRGVTVKILTNSLASTDNLEAFSGYKRDREKLLEIGLDIYEFKPDAAIRYDVMTGALQKELDYAPIFGLHAKSMVIDEQIAVIGTFNLDPRSANLNTECVAVIYDKRIAGKLYEMMERDIKPENAWHTTSTFNPDDEAGWWKEFKVWTRRGVPEEVL